MHKKDESHVLYKNYLKFSTNIYVSLIKLHYISQHVNRCYIKASSSMLYEQLPPIEVAGKLDAFQKEQALLNHI